MLETILGWWLKGAPHSSAFFQAQDVAHPQYVLGTCVASQIWDAKLGTNQPVCLTLDRWVRLVRSAGVPIQDDPFSIWAT